MWFGWMIDIVVIVAEELKFDPINVESLRKDKNFIKANKKGTKDLETMQKKHAKDKETMIKNHCTAIEKISKGKKSDSFDSSFPLSLDILVLSKQDSVGLSASIGILSRRDWRFSETLWHLTKYSLLFFDILCYSLLFFAILCYSLLFFDILWYSLIFFDILWYSLVRSGGIEECHEI